MSSRSFPTPQLLAFALLAAACVHAEPSVTVETGVIEAAPFAIAKPAHWNGNLLLLAHGYRDPSAPLIADLNPRHKAYATLLGEGWMVAKTGYRRNGIIVRDAITDIENLRAHIAAAFGEPRRVFLEGDSMGGAIVTLIAEQPAGRYQGAIAIGAALGIREGDAPLVFTHQPCLPVVFLTNQSELTDTAAYLSATSGARSRALLLRVGRDGHVNVNQSERLLALRTVLSLANHRPVSLPAIAGQPGWFEGTQTPSPTPSQVRPLDAGGFEARVTEATAIFGNLALNAQPDDFARAAIAPGSWFELAAKGATFRVFYGRTFSDVPRGEWIAFPNADGYFYLGRNRGNAASTASLKEGDPVVIRPLRK